MNRKILALAIPNIITNVTIPLLGLVDIGVMGHLNSEVFLGAIALGGIIFQIIFWGFSFLRMGTSGFTAQAYGSRNFNECAMALSRSVLLGLIIGIALLLLQRPVEWIAFRFLNGSSEVKYYAEAYFRIRIWSAPATLCLYGFTGWFIGMQNARFPMYVSILVNVINIGLNIFFVIGLHLKSEGIALGSVIAQYCGLLMAIMLFLNYYRRFLKRWNYEAMINLLALRNFVMVNRDIFIRTLCVIFVLSFFTFRSAAVNNSILAVNSILWQYLLLFSFFVDGLAYAGEALTGRFIGARDMVSLKKSIRLLFVWGLIICIPFTFMYLFFGNSLMSILTDNPKVIEAARPYLMWTVLIPLVTFAAFIWDGIYIGATSSKAMRNTMLFSTLIIFLPIYYLTRGTMGNHGLWLALMLYMTSRGIWLTILFKKTILKRIANGMYRTDKD